MSRRTTAIVLSALMAMSVFVPLAAGGGPAALATDATTTASTPAQTELVPDEQAPAASQSDDGEAPPDPEEDRLGWENGYWYNESIPVTPEDGYNETEVERILARSMARVERIRGLEFGETPTVNFVPRDEYSEVRSQVYRDSLYSNLSEKDRLHQNTKFEALFMVPEDESYFEDLIANQGGSAAAFYTSQGIPELDVGAGEIAMIVPEEGRASKFNEYVLGHELVHRLQDTNLGVIDTFRGGATEEAANVNTSLTEGEATLVGQRYRVRCGGEWDCLPTPDSSPAGLLSFENPGLVMYGLGPYSETARLFAAADERGGVEAMNAIYENPPTSTEQLLHPEAYPDDTPAEIDYTDTSSDEWSMQTFENGVNYATFGEMGIFTMLYYPNLRARSNIVMSPNFPFQGVSSPARYDYTHPASAGWDGDKMFIYTNATSAETNETAYVWETRWDSEEDAQEFADAYTTVLTEYADATEVSGRADTYRAPDDSGYGDAFYVNTSGQSVTIVNAPTVDDLPEVSEGAAPEVEETTPTTTTPATTAAPTTEPTTEEPMETTGAMGTTEAMDTTAPDEGDGDGGSPGLGVFAALTALAAALVLWRRRTER